MPTIVRGKCYYQQSLSAYTSWRTGGPAKCIFIPADIEDLITFLQATSPDEPLAWIGLGSNLLIRDSGFNGTVIITQGALVNKNNNPESFFNKHTGLIRLEAGMACGTAARLCARLGLTGLEFLAGVPGTIGGALAMNAGAHGSETWQFVRQCETLNRQGELRLRARDEYQANYRHVVLKNKNAGTCEWFTAGYFELIPGDKEASLLKIKHLLAHRSATQPINYPNCGSVFRNPPGQYAAQLIESCGLKNHRIGGASFSEKHANFIINHGNASSADIEQLIQLAIDTVRDKHGIDLIREVHILGENLTRNTNA